MRRNRTSKRRKSNLAKDIIKIGLLILIPAIILITILIINQLAG